MDTAEQLVLQKILSAMETYQATDLHLSVGNPPMMRVRGNLVAMPDQPLITGPFIDRVKDIWLDPYHAGLLQENKDVVCARTFENKRRFKISAYYQQGYVTITLSLIPTTLPQLQSSGLPALAQRLVLLDHGLVCVSGPASAGAHITAASFVEYLNQTAQRHVITIEKPVEYIFQDNLSVIEQREVGVDVPSVEQGLRSAFDEDVDVVLVTTLPSLEAWKAAIALASAGKLVIAALHANSTVSVLQSIFQQANPNEYAQLRTDLAGCLVGMINQRIAQSVKGDPLLIAELLIPNDAVRTVIQSGDLLQIHNILFTSREEGMRSLDMSLRVAVETGQITRQEAAKHAENSRLFM